MVKYQFWVKKNYYIIRYNMRAAAILTFDKCLYFRGRLWLTTARRLSTYMLSRALERTTVSSLCQKYMLPGGTPNNRACMLVSGLHKVPLIQSFYISLKTCGVPLASVMTKALVPETEAKTNVPGFKAKTEAEAVASKTEAKIEALDPETEAKAARQLNDIGYSIPINIKYR